MFDKNHSPQQNQNTYAAYMVTQEDNNHHGWYHNKGATNHIINDLSNLAIKENDNGNEKLITRNKYGLSIPHTIKASITTSNPNKKLALHNMLFVPEIVKNLLSISSLTLDNNVVVESDGKLFHVKDERRRKFC